MVIRLNVTVKNDKFVFKYLRKVGTNLPAASNNILKRYANFVRRSARRRAKVGRWAASGKLRDSIRVETGEKNSIKIIADSRSAPAQELGFTPHYISIEHLSKEARDAMKTYSRGMTKTGTGSGKKGVIFVRQSKPYFSPAIDKANTKLPAWIDEEMNKAIRG